MADDLVLSSTLEQLRGVIGRYPEVGQRVVFAFDAVDQRVVHMVGVSRPLVVEFFVGEELVRTEKLRPWVGMAMEECDRVIERRPD